MISLKGLGLLLFVSLNCDADIYNRQMLPLGEKSAFLANTGTGDSSSGAVYYNPAALTGVNGNKLSVSGSAYFKFSIKFDAITNIDNTNIPYEAAGFNTIPSTLVSSIRKGDWHFAFSTLVPISLHIENATQQRTPNNFVTLQPNTTEQELWVGLSAARKINEKWSMGVSVFGIQFSKSDQSGISILTPSSPANFLTALTKVTQTNYGLSVVGGVWYRPSEVFDFGLRVQSPFMPVAGEADVYNAVIGSIGGSPVNNVEDKKEVVAKYDLPTDMTLGGVYHPNSLWSVMLDVSHQWGADYMLIPDYSQSESFHAKPTFRFSAGVERKVTNHASLLAGFQHNPSAMREFEEISDLKSGKNRIDVLGATLGLIYTDEHVQSGVGVFYLGGKGKARMSNGAINGVSLAGYGVMLTTSYVF